MKNAKIIGVKTQNLMSNKLYDGIFNGRYICTFVKGNFLIKMKRIP
jgi:hypothetical protein